MLFLLLALVTTPAQADDDVRVDGALVEEDGSLACQISWGRGEYTRCN